MCGVVRITKGHKFYCGSDRLKTGCSYLALLERYKKKSKKFLNGLTQKERREIWSKNYFARKEKETEYKKLPHVREKSRLANRKYREKLKSIQTNNRSNNMKDYEKTDYSHSHCWKHTVGESPCGLKHSTHDTACCLCGRKREILTNNKQEAIYDRTKKARAKGR